MSEHRIVCVNWIAVAGPFQRTIHSLVASTRLYEFYDNSINLGQLLRKANASGLHFVADDEQFRPGGIGGLCQSFGDTFQSKTC